MNYKGTKVLVTGHTGFIGKPLLKALEVAGADAYSLRGDTRDPATWSDVDHTYDYIFHFAAPSSQVLFKANPSYCVDVTVNGFINAAQTARRVGAKLIYPSTGILSFDRMNEYARCKKICEDIHLGENLNALGLRIFMGYGPGEGHKGQYASPAYLFAKDMVNGKSPIVWGDGKQERDLIYIDDLINAIVVLATEATEQIIDIGTGTPESFNQMIAVISNILLTDAPKPTYIGKPAGYVEKTAADPTVLHKYYKPRFGLADGLNEIVKKLKGDQSE